MRLSYFDDAGLFNGKQEPFIVIGGCIVDGDQQLVALEDELDRLICKHIPEQDRPGFVFHTTELWSGGRYFKRDKWPLEKRLKILHDIADIPQKLDIPLTFGHQSREAARRFAPDRDWTERDLELSLYADTYARFAESVEQVMREVWSEENAILIGEDNDAIRSMVKVAHNHFRDRQWVEATNPNLIYFPFERIREGVHFSPKNESRPLQIADFVTFFVRKRLMKDRKAWDFYAKIEPHLLIHPLD